MNIYPTHENFLPEDKVNESMAMADGICERFPGENNTELRLGFLAAIFRIYSLEADRHLLSQKVYALVNNNSKLRL